MLVLFIGIVLSGIVGLWTGSFDIWGWNASMGLGITNMGELIIVTLLAGGMLEMIRYNGGYRLDHPQAYLPHPFLQRGRDEHSGLGELRQPLHGQQYDRPHHGRPDRQGYSGPVQDRSRRSASLLDIFSCFVQGIIPYGAQMLMAAGLGHVSPIEIMQYLYYPYLLGAGALLAILFNYPRKYTVN